MNFTREQTNRLRELGAAQTQLDEDFPEAASRNRRFQELETRLAGEQLEKLRAFCASGGRPFILTLQERLSARLRGLGFTEVHTPIIMSRSRLEKMGVFEGSSLERQVFWLDAKRCLRPMLAPHLYEYMRELGRALPRPIRFFEIGPCFRKESESACHANEFTMLNLVEMGLPAGLDKRARLGELGAAVLETAGVEGWRLIEEDSGVYGETLDFVSAEGLELASSASGPLPMDAAFGITDDWIGIGFGLERLSMTVLHEPNLAKTGRSFTHLNGISLRLRP